jgi:antitoxin VapB
MSLNIKNEETHRLVRELAELTGESQTSAVEDAVRRRIAELRRDTDFDDRMERLRAISRRTAAAMDPSLSNDPNEFLYDEFGLPR